MFMCTKRWQNSVSFNASLIVSLDQIVVWVTAFLYTHVLNCVEAPMTVLADGKHCTILQNQQLKGCRPSLLNTRKQSPDTLLPSAGGSCWPLTCQSDQS